MGLWLFYFKDTSVLLKNIGLQWGCIAQQSKFYWVVTFDWFIITELSVFLIALYTYKVCTRRRKRYGLGSQVLGLSNGWNLASPNLSSLLCTHRVYNLHSPARGSGSHCPCEKLLELNTVDFLPSCNVLTSFKHSVNYSWDLKRNKYSYIHQSQWGVNKSAQKNTFSVKGSSKQEVFIGEEKRFCKAALGIFTNYIPIPGRLQARRLRTGSPLINPRVILSQQASKQDFLGQGCSGSFWPSKVTLYSVNLLPGEDKKLPFLLLLCLPNMQWWNRENTVYACDVHIIFYNFFFFYHQYLWYGHSPYQRMID